MSPPPAHNHGSSPTAATIKSVRQVSRFLAEMMESVEDIPRQAILDGLPWDWSTYGEYLAWLDRTPKGVNAGGMVGHCAVRVAAMGERSLSEDPASPADVAAMCAVPLVP